MGEQAELEIESGIIYDSYSLDEQSESVHYDEFGHPMREDENGSRYYTTDEGASASIRRYNDSIK